MKKKESIKLESPSGQLLNINPQPSTLIMQSPMSPSSPIPETSTPIVNKSPRIDGIDIDDTPDPSPLKMNRHAKIFAS